MYKKTPYFILVCLFCFAAISSSCNKEPDRPTIISKLKSTARLSTVEYIVSKVVSAKENNRLGKDAYFFAETEATIKAGIDLDKLREEDIKIDGRKINIKLPPIEILNFSYPAESYKIVDKYYIQGGIFNWNALSLEDKDELYRQAEIDIRGSLKDLGIVLTAQKNTKQLLNKILLLLGFEEIYIEFRDDSGKLQTPDNQIWSDLSEFLEKNKKN